MAHECPNCGQQCYCNGDIDDCCFSFPEAVAKCDHCDEDDELELPIPDYEPDEEG